MKPPCFTAFETKPLRQGAVKSNEPSENFLIKLCRRCKTEANGVHASVIHSPAQKSIEKINKSFRSKFPLFCVYLRSFAFLFISRIPLLCHFSLSINSVCGGWNYAKVEL